VPTEVVLSIAQQVEGLLWNAVPTDASAPAKTLTHEQRQALLSLLTDMLPGVENRRRRRCGRDPGSRLRGANEPQNETGARSLSLSE
jgi:hypothetical protein